MWMILMLLACDLGLDPMCCPPDKSRPSKDRGPIEEYMWEAAAYENVCIAPLDIPRNA